MRSGQREEENKGMKDGRTKKVGKQKDDEGLRGCRLPSPFFPPTPTIMKTTEIE